MADAKNYCYLCRAKVIGVTQCLYFLRTASREASGFLV